MAFCLFLGMALAELLLDLLGHLVDGGIKIRLAILGEKIRSTDSEFHGTAKGLFRRTRMIMVQCDPNIDGLLIEVLKLVDAGEHMLLDGLGQSHVVRGQNEFHILS